VVLGDGDCSFSLSLGSLGLARVTATTLDTRAQLGRHFGEEVMQGRLRALEEQGCEALCGVDATLLHRRSDLHPLLACCDVVWWNFPFTGAEEDDAAQEALLRGFLTSVGTMVRYGQLRSTVEVLCEHPAPRSLADADLGR
jgi:hypothetical protein